MPKYRIELHGYKTVACSATVTISAGTPEEAQAKALSQAGQMPTWDFENGDTQDFDCNEARIVAVNGRRCPLA